jgi:hypothetical protein
METMLTPDKNYPFDEITIKTPKALQGGTYCANLEINNGPIVIQTPKCKTKNGIHKTAKQIYCDLLMTQDHQDFIDWLDLFQERVRALILENSSKWFHEEPTIDEIEYNWNNSSRVYKSSNYLVRSFVHKAKGLNKVSLQIFDTDEIELGIDDFKNDKKVICILEIIGLKFSANSFHLEICLRQMMVINEKPLFNKCLIKFKNTAEQPIKEENDKEEEEEEEIEKKDEKEENTDSISNSTVTIVQPIDDNNDTKQTDIVDQSKNEQNTENTEINNIADDTKKTENEIQESEEETTLPLEKNEDLEEIELFVPEDEPMKLKKPSDVYLDIYKQAREKAKKAKNEAIKAYLEAKRIKELYMLDIVDSTDSEDSEEDEEELFSEN